MMPDVKADVQTRGGQAIDVFSLAIASALFFSIPAVKESTEPLRTKVKSFIKGQFTNVSGSSPAVPVAPSNCALVPVSHSPAALLIMDKKFPDAGCPAPAKK